MMSTANERSTGVGSGDLLGDFLVTFIGDRC
jgi:hypothetical protein